LFRSSYGEAEENYAVGGSRGRYLTKENCGFNRYRFIVLITTNCSTLGNGLRTLIMQVCISSFNTEGRGFAVDNFGNGVGDSDRVDVSIEHILEILEWEVG
jgi:hypothetical protein